MVPIRSPRHTYGLVVGVVIVLLLAGLLVPLTLGDPESEIAASGGGSDAGPLGALTTTTSIGSASSPGGSTPSPDDGVVAGPGASVPGAPTTGALGADAGGGAAAAGGPRTASDVGVTPTTIRVGVVLLDLEAVAPLGLGIENHSVEDQRRVFQAYLDDINARGGINGRQVEAVYARNDPLETGSARARCLELARDHEVFAVLGYVAEEVPCLVQEQRRPTLGYNNYPSAYYSQSGHYLITGQPTAERVAANWAGALDQLGSLDGRRLGIVAQETEVEALPADGLQATLGQLGHEVAYRARIAADTDTALAQIPIEAQRMRDAGVDTVFLSTNFAVARTWVENAESQGWAPQYLTSEVGQLTSDDLVDQMPASFGGAIGIVNAGGGQTARDARAGEPERPENTACRDVYNRTTDGAEYAYGEVSPIGVACPLVQIFERAATAAGPDLTRDGFVAAVQSLGAVPLPTYPGGSFAPGKTDYNDTVRPIRWAAPCRCYDVAGPLMRGRF